MSKPTPRPWEFRGNAMNGNLLVPHVNGAGGEPVCMGYLEGEQAKANAAHIVKVVNMHAELVDALKAANREVFEMLHIAEDAQFEKQVNKLYDKISKLIAKAEAE